MEEMYSFHSTSSYTVPSENNRISPENHNHGFQSSVVDHSYWQPVFGSDDLSSVTASIVTDSVSIETNPDHIILPRRRSNQRSDDDYDAYRDTIKEKVASHPSYPKLLDAYIDCQKVGAPVEIASLLDDIRHENDVVRKLNATGSDSSCLGVDPELDVFMETFCHLLMKYKSDLARPVDEATVFIRNIQTQLYNLGKDEVTVSSDEEVSGCETDNMTQMSQELKDMLLRRFGGRISSLKHEFTKKKKKGKLPKEARLTLLQWWNSHYKWPYPTEGDKITLAETTGLDSKQINNWFINQRKRHWKPSEAMQLAVMGHIPLYED